MPKRKHSKAAAPAAAAPAEAPMQRGDEGDESDGGDGEEEQVLAAPSSGASTSCRVKYVNKQRVLVLCSRGITARHRHLLEDLKKLMPHHKSDTKLDSKGDPRALNEVAELKSCNGVVYLEARKRTDLYMWVSRAPAGPSAKFLVQNVHTMDELRLTGNCGLGTRPLLCFDAAFDVGAPWACMKQLLATTFGTPRGHAKSKPFFDHSISFALADGKIWVRHYQIVDSAADERLGIKDAVRGDDSTTLVEIGPRFVLSPIRVFAGSFGGATLYHDTNLVLPNDERAHAKQSYGSKYVQRKDDQSAREAHVLANATPGDELLETFRQSDEALFA
ncbi:Brix domain-containing protein [Pelagophyceae sp. CCMP2097]|nr:Brix domain-containing protein [Pelagophyceae sp. CCMP2097]